jgi:WD40 repeat protein
MAATLGGLDVGSAKQSPVNDIQLDTVRIAFNRDGRRLLMSCTQPRSSEVDLVRVWNLGTNKTERIKVASPGPVLFLEDGTPLQVRPMENNFAWNVVDLTDNSIRVQLELPTHAGQTKPQEVLATADATVFACLAETDAGTASALVWDGTTGSLLRQHGQDLSALGISPDGTLLAGGNSQGAIFVWSVESGEAIAELQSGHCEIHCFAFSQDRRRWSTPRGKNMGQGWLLAAGDSGGTVTVWDVGAELPRSFCRGSQWNVYAVAFSPDGMTLASTGRGQTKIWDVATGHLLLDVWSGNWMTDLAYSPDGRKLAVSSRTAFNVQGRVDAYGLEYGRGIQELRGLVSRVVRVTFSPNGNRVAALSNDWEIAVWDVPSSRLRHVFIPPPGLSPDNAAMAFSPKGDRLAFSSGNQAILWDLESGKQLSAWPLPPGLVDLLAFPTADRLLSFRVETKDGVFGPYGEVSPAEHPRICRIRDLLSPNDPLRAEIADFPWGVLTALMSSDGKYIFVDGKVDGSRRALRVFDASGIPIWDIPTARTAPNSIRITPTGHILSTSLDDEHRVDLLDLQQRSSTGRSIAAVPICLGPEARRWIVSQQGISASGRGISLCANDRDLPLVTLGIDQELGHLSVCFDPTGRFIAWGDSRGTLHVCDIVEVNRRLTDAGLGW